MSTIKESQALKVLGAQPLTAAEFEALPATYQRLLTELTLDVEEAVRSGDTQALGRADARLAGMILFCRERLERHARLAAIPPLRRRRRGVVAWLLGLLRGKTA